MSQTISAYPVISGNNILNRLEADEYQRLLRFFRVVDLEAQQTLYAPGDEIAHAYFPVDSVVTAVATMNDGSTVETAMVGREGVVGIGAAVGGYRARYWTRVLLPGEALRVEVGLLRELFNDSPVWQKLLLPTAAPPPPASSASRYVPRGRVASEAKCRAARSDGGACCRRRGARPG